jgi:hypothetical protein
MREFKVSAGYSISVGKVPGRKNQAIIVTEIKNIEMHSFTVGYCSSDADAEVLCSVLNTLSIGMASYRQQLDMIKRVVDHGHLTFEDIL